MTNIAILRRRQMRFQHTDGDDIVMAVIATRRIPEITLCMTEGARGKGTGSMTDAAVLAGGQMLGVLPGCGNAMAGSTIIDDAGMIKYCTDKAAGVMAYTAIFGGGDMCRRLADGVNAVIAGMAIRTRL